MKSSKNTLFIVFGLFLLGGVFIQNYLEQCSLSFLVLVLVLILFLNFYCFKKKLFVRMLLALVWWILWILISILSTSTILEKLLILEKHYKNHWEVILEVRDTYKLSNFNWEYIVNIKTFNNYSYKGIDWIISIPSNFTIAKWDIIKVYEKLLPIDNFVEGFNYKKFMYSKNIFFKIQASSISKIWHKQPYFLLIKIDDVRKKFLEKIHKLYPEEEAIFLGWILLWARESLPQDLKDDFNASGLTHFIAVSGFNITILIVFFSFILKVFPIGIRVLAITIFIVLFTLLVWDAAPVIRASIMGLLAYYIMVWGRNPHHLALLLFTACVMVYISPLILNYDVSFHLSFLAVVWIIYTQHFWKKLFHFLPETLAIREAFVLTLSALVFAFPVMVFNFGQLSLLAPFANIAVTWTIPLAMLFGFISIMIDSIFPAVWEIITYVTWVLLAWDIKVVHFFGELDWAIIKYDFWIWKYSLQILYFIIIVFIINVCPKKKN